MIRNLIQLATVLALSVLATPLRAETILVFGDSWSKPVAARLRKVLTENGHTDVTAMFAAPFILELSELKSQQGLAQISAWLDVKPDANFVHLSIGDNDLNRNWEPALAGTQAEADLLAKMIEDIEIVVDHIHSVRPGARVFWSSYDFFRPLEPTNLRGTPAEVNALLLKLSERATEFAASRSPGTTYGDFNGLMQVTYGFDGIQHSQFDPPFSIPPGDPSLPDPAWPGPNAAFGDTPKHPTTEGYKVLAQAQYDSFYASALSAQAFQINAGLNDAWFNLTTAGQGFLITVFPDRKEVFLAWFTYDTERPPEDVAAMLGEPGHRWLTAQGPYDGDTANLTIFMTEGGVFDAAVPAASTDPAGDGTMTLEFADCTEGLVNYEITSLGISGAIPIQRITQDNVPLCEALANP